MSPHTQFRFFSILTVLVFVLSLTTPLTVYADGETPPTDPPATELAPPDNPPQQDDPPTQDADQAQPDQPAPTQDVAQDPPAADPSTSPEQAPVDVAEVIAQVPDSTDVIVLNDDGSTEPLASQQAVEIISNSDPVWCPSGQTPGGAGCTPNQVTITDLLAYLQDTTNGISGAGTIYFQDGAYGGSENPIAIDGSVLTNLASIALEGGWDLGTNTKVINGTTTFSGALNIVNWNGTVSVADINIVSAAADTGLYVTATGGITVSNVSSSGNTTGSGVDLNTCFITANGCTGAGDISVTDSTFNDNYIHGVWAQSGGDITLDNVTAQANNHNGASLIASGDIQVANSDLSNNDMGLSVVSEGDVTLESLTVTGNDGDGVSVADYFSTTGDACVGRQVTIDGGTFQNNGGYGVFVAPGTQGSVSIINNPIFGGNGLGDTLTDMLVHCDEKSDEPGEEYPDEGDKKPVHHVELPETDGELVEQDCEAYSATLLDLPNGIIVEVGCPFTGESTAELVEEGGLPAPIPLGPDFVSGVSVELSLDGQPLDLMTEGGKITMRFPVPEGMEAGHFSILYWDSAANDGQGDWVELPLAQFGGGVPLNPDDPDDARTIFSGVQVSNGYVSVSVDFPGVFVMVGR